MKKKTIPNNSRQKIFIDIFIIFLFILGSYFIISSKYNFVNGDEGTYAFKTKILYENHELDLKNQAALSIGQLVIGYVFSTIFGYSLKTLHRSVYFTVFFCIISFYFLLLQTGIERYLALIGSLSLFINPLTLRFIDWYITEPFFLLYILIALNLYVAALKSSKVGYLYLGSVFTTIAIFTRQHSIFLPIALIAFLMIKRQQFKDYFYHFFLSSVIPLIATATFYLLSTTQGDYAIRLQHLKRLTNPLYLSLTLLKDLLYSLHYSVLYTLPLLMIILIGALIKKDYLKDLFLKRPFLLAISISCTSLGTIIVFFQFKKLMPYLPNIFSIGNITSLFGIKILKNKTASVLLTIFTAFGAALILSRIFEYFHWKKLKKFFTEKNQTEATILIRHFMYISGIFYFLTSVILLLLYDRYIFPLAIFVIFFILIKFSWITNFKKTGLIIFLIIYSIFIVKIKNRCPRAENLWDAGNLLISKGINPKEINGGSGFGFYHNFYSVRKIYKNVKIKRPINWHKFHPMANFFLSSKSKFKKHPGLEIFDTVKNEKNTIYIYKRKPNYQKPIWIH